MTTQGLPQVIVVGDQRFADLLSTCGAAWQVLPAVESTGAMWDAIEMNILPQQAAAVIITDGTASGSESLEATLAAFAPYARTFVVSMTPRASQILTKVQEEVNRQGGQISAPVFHLPAENLQATIDVLRQYTQDIVAWNQPAPTQQPAPVAPAQTFQQPPAPVAYEAPVAPPAPMVQPPAQTFAPAPAFAAPAEPAVATYSQTISTDQPRDYEQASFYAESVLQQMGEDISKRADALPNQMTIACMSSKGGAGKSSVAISLAGTIARSSAAAGNPKRVVLVDLDTRDGQVGSLIGQYMPTAINIRYLEEWNAETVKANLVHDKRLGIDALLAPVRPRNADDVGPDFYRQIIQILQTTHDVVVLDCSVNYLDPLLGMAFNLADEILFVTTLATTSVHGMARSLTEMFKDPADGGLGIPREKVGIVANQVINAVGMGKDKLLRAALGAPIVGQIPAEHDVVLIATNSNRMDQILKHPRLGPAFFSLATTCLPGMEMAPVAATSAPEPEQANQEKKRGFFAR